MGGACLLPSPRVLSNSPSVSMKSVFACMRPRIDGSVESSLRRRHEELGGARRSPGRKPRAGCGKTAPAIHPPDLLPPLRNVPADLGLGRRAAGQGRQMFSQRKRRRTSMVQARSGGGGSGLVLVPERQPDCDPPVPAGRPGLDGWWVAAGEGRLSARAEGATHRRGRPGTGGLRLRIECPGTLAASRHCVRRGWCPGARRRPAGLEAEPGLLARGPRRLARSGRHSRRHDPLHADRARSGDPRRSQESLPDLDDGGRGHSAALLYEPGRPVSLSLRIPTARGERRPPRGPVPLERVRPHQRLRRSTLARGGLPRRLAPGTPLGRRAG